MDTNFIHVIALCIILAVEISCENAVAVTNNFRDKIALEVLKVSPVNTVVCPMALRLPLCKILPMASEVAKRELMSALGIQRERQINCYDAVRKELSITEMAELTMHNRIYVNDSLDLNPVFTNNTLSQFGVRIGKIGFRYPKNAARIMNRLAASDTLFRVSSLIEEDDIDANTSMIFLSGVHFKGNWESPFDVRLTKDKIFRDESNQPTFIPMMSKMGNFHYVDEVNHDVKVLTLKFFSMGISITYVMPGKKNGLPQFLEKLSKDPTLMKTLKSKLESAYMTVYLPRIKIKTYVDWTDFLRLIGINKILETDTRGLDGILRNGTNSDIPVHLSKAKQKVFVEIDELGLSRAIPEDIDASRYRYTSNTDEFVLDQPFYFTVTLDSNGVTHDLFNGVYRKPE